MPRARNEFYADALKVVVRIAECLNLEFAAIAGAGIYMANAERAAQNIPQVIVLFLDCRRNSGWSGISLCQNPRAYHARERVDHTQFTRRVRCRTS